MSSSPKDEKSMCVRLKPDEYAHLTALARACGETPHGMVRRLVRLARVVRPIAVRQPELTLAASD